MQPLKSDQAETSAGERTSWLRTQKVCYLEDALKKIGSKLGFVVLGILSLFGINPATATNIPLQPPPQVNEVKSTTPLYLELGADVLSQLGKEKNITLAQHWSHGAHRSHWAHYAHRAHYSHYDRYR